MQQDVSPFRPSRIHCLLANTSDGKPHSTIVIMVTEEDSYQSLKPAAGQSSECRSLRKPPSVSSISVRVRSAKLLVQKVAAFNDANGDSFQGSSALFGAPIHQGPETLRSNSTSPTARTRPNFGPAADQQSGHSLPSADCRTEIECLRALV